MNTVRTYIRIAKLILLAAAAWLMAALSYIAIKHGDFIVQTIVPHIMSKANTPAQPQNRSPNARVPR